MRAPDRSALIREKASAISEILSCGLWGASDEENQRISEERYRFMFRVPTCNQEVSDFLLEKNNQAMAPGRTPEP